MFSEKLSPLKLDESKKIGYTYKCLGAAFWAFKQNDFRAALEKICFKVRSRLAFQFVFFLSAGRKEKEWVNQASI